MKLNKSNLITLSIIGSTVILGGIAIFTAFKLYQLQQKPTPQTQAETPEIPENFLPEATPNVQNTACEALVFTIGGKTSMIAVASTPTASPKPSITPSPTPSPSPTPTPTKSPTPTPTTSPISTKTPSPTPTQTQVASQPQLPIAGVSLPSVIGIISGALLIGAAFLAL